MYPNLQPPLKNKMSTKQCFTINFIHLIQKANQMLSTFTYQCQLSPSPLSVGCREATLFQFTTDTLHVTVYTT